MAMADRKPKFYSELEAMNKEILRVLEGSHKKSPHFDYSNTFRDYIKQLEDLYKEYPLVKVEDKKEEESASTVNKSTTTFNNISASSTGNSNNNLGQSLFNNSLSSSNTTITSNSNFNPTTLGGTFTASSNGQSNDNGEQANETADGDEDDALPESTIDIYEEPDYRHKVLCKLYEKPHVGQPQLMGFGTLFIKDLETPDRLHLIIRKNPDLRTIILNLVVTSQTPMKLSPKIIHIFVPDADGKTKTILLKVRDEQTGSEVFEHLQSVKRR